MKIKPSEIFHTPKDWDELEAWINAHSPTDRIHLYTAAGMAWNLAASIQDKPVTEDANAQF